MTKLDWQAQQHREELAGKQAEAIVGRLGLAKPIDPFEVIKSETPLLRAGGANFGDSFDGKLKFNRDKNRFLLFYNNKYDTGLTPLSHHPRTRFTIAHELGHYFIEEHHAHLRRGGLPHRSSTEFVSNARLEREADAFAAGLLLPRQLVRPLVNRGELTLRVLDDIAQEFETSLLSTCIRGVRLSDFPCAVAGIRGGQIAWMFPSEQLVAGGCYPGKSSPESPSARQQWERYLAGANVKAKADGMARHWFQMFDKEDELHGLYVTEHFFPVRTMDTLVVLLTIDEDDLFSEADEDREYDE